MSSTGDASTARRSENGRPGRGARGRSRLLAAARDELAEVGTAGVSLRSIARRAGVSHAAPTYHFADRAGLLTALAAEGFAALRGALERTEAGLPADAGPRQRLAALGRAYLDVAVAEPAVFDLMFRPDLLRRDDPGLLAEQLPALTALRRAVGADEREADGRVAIAWAFIHGLAVLVLQDALPGVAGREPAERARAVTELIDGFAGRLVG